MIKLNCSKWLMSCVAVLIGTMTGCAEVPTLPIRSVSLKMLQQQALAAHGAMPADVANMAGLTQVLGYFTDDANQDLILFGYAQRGASVPLRTEDFCVALRNAWMKYARLKGDTYEYEYPGCSIDPDPATWRKLAETGQSLNSDSDDSDIKRKLDQWCDICKEWQTVRVMGTPFNCGFASTAVVQDYDMKVLVDGSEVLPLPGVVSLTGMKMQAVQTAVAHNRPISVSLAGMNRFWFYPGPNRYDEDTGIILIRRCPVVLLTEEMALGRKNGYGGTGHSDPLAESFADGFSQLYGKVAEIRPGYRDLENLFRWFALAQIIHLKELPGKPGLNLDASLKGGFDISGLLSKYPVATVVVEKELRGRSAIKEFKHEEDTSGGKSTYQLWLQSCGGVGIEIEPKPEDFSRPTPSLRRLKETSLTARPSPRTLYWDMEAQEPAVVEINRALDLGDMESRMAGRADKATLAQPTGRRVVAIERVGDNYQVYTSKEMIGQTKTMSGLMEMFQAANLLAEDHLTVITAGFAKNTLTAFEAQFGHASDKLAPGLAKLFVDENSPEAALFRAATSPGVKLETPSLADDSGKPSARTSSVFSFTTWERGATEEFSVEIDTQNAELGEGMRRAVLDRLAPGSSVDNVYGIIMDARDRLLKKLRLHLKDIQIRFRNQNGTIETGAINAKRPTLPA